MMGVTFNDKTRQAVQKINGLTDGSMREFTETMDELSKEPAEPKVPRQRKTNRPLVAHAQYTRGGVQRATGALARSLSWTRERIKKYRLFSQTGYGGFVHEGTARITGNPFYTRAAEGAIDEFQDIRKWSK